MTKAEMAVSEATSFRISMAFPFRSYVPFMFSRRFGVKIRGTKQGQLVAKV
jgi:hypothetical protein